MIRCLIACAVALSACAALAASPEEDAALRAIDEFATQQARIDPHFKQAEIATIGQIDQIIKGRPVAEWAPGVRRAYLAASGKLHEEERERVRTSEIRAMPDGLAGASGQARNDALQQRLEALTSALEAGKMGWREQALHAMEAARLYFPDDAALIQWRRAKVPIATAYEMGQISRDELESRWGAATAEYQRAAAVRAQSLAPPPFPALTELPRPGDQIRRPQVNCTSRNVPGIGIQTTCR